MTVFASTLALAPVAWSTDNVHPLRPHWHYKTQTYRLDWNLPSGWKRAIAEAGSTWTFNTPQAYLRWSNGDTDAIYSHVRHVENHLGVTVRTCCS